MNFKCGAGIAKMNPTPMLFPFPTPGKADWGVGPLTCTAIYDDINARALALESGDSRLLLITMELSGVPPFGNIKEKVAEKTGFPEERIVLIATHNHTGYPVDKGLLARFPKSERLDEWLKELERVITEAAVSAATDAVQSLRPAKYGYGECESWVNTNRDYKTLGGYWVEARNLAGYSEKTVSLVKFVDMDNRPIAVLMNYGCHATCAYLMRDFDGKRKTSGNFTGIASRFVEEHYGNGCVALWTSGAAGNVNPILSHGLQYEYPDGWTSAVDYPDGVGYMQMESIGRQHGADCVRGIDSINHYSDTMSLTRIRKIVDLPAQKKVEEITGSNSASAFRMGGRGVRNYEEIPYGNHPSVPEGHKFEDDPDHPVKIEMGIIMLGDVAIICANAELYAEIGRDLKTASPYKKTFVMTHTSRRDVEGREAGYILDKSAADRGEKVFQAFGSVKPGASDNIIVKAACDMFDELLGLEQYQ